MCLQSEREISECDTVLYFYTFTQLLQSGFCGLQLFCLFLHDGQISPFHFLTREKVFFCAKCNKMKNTMMSIKCVINALYLIVIVY